MKDMKLKITNQGLIIPKEYFIGIDSVKIRKQNDIIVVYPEKKDDPIRNLGKNPVKIGIKDASINLDKYLYNYFE
jgi:hypothetical protein